MANIKFVRRINRIVQFLKLRKDKGATFEEIVDYILEKEGTELTKRTFQRDKKDILEAFDVSIVFHRQDNTYRIEKENEELEEEENVFDNLLLMEAYREFKNREDIIIFERRKNRGLNHINSLIQAIDEKKVVRFHYESYWENGESDKSIQPYALKEFQHRWYLLGKEHKPKDGNVQIKIYSLDRITNLDISKSTFKKESFDVQKLFQHSYGIVLPHEEPQEILLSFDKQNAQYIQSLPLHHSQKVIKETETETIFLLYLVPTFDFWQKILSYGWHTKVLAPKSFANIIANELQKAVQNYKK
ncbi:MAG: WYL domain-containing protein [Cruoricaptor ignavus]|nr:WYL domain-containing protein [Cruoricaptor ignavus]